MVRVAHVITGLGLGGAESMLVRLLEQVDRHDVESTVISLTDTLDLADRLDAAGVGVVRLGGVKGSVPGLALAVRRSLAHVAPDVVQTWLYKADLVGGLAARSVRGLPLIWSIRQTSLDPERSTRSNLLTARACARLSRRVPSRILCVSEEARAVHAAAGYDATKMQVIPNGFDLDRFRPRDDAGRSLRAELGLEPTREVVGLVARFDPQKDHATFLAAFRRVVDRFPGAVAVLCGSGCTPDNAPLAEEVRHRGLGASVRMLGPRVDVERITAGLDVAVSSSAFGEGFSNSIGEALACGVPVVATDSGNARALLAGVGWVVPPSDPGALAGAVSEALVERPEDRQARVATGRARMEGYSLPAVADRYVAVWEEVARCAAS